MSDFLTDTEVATIVRNSIVGYDRTEIDEDEVERIVRWCHEARLATAMLELILEGNIAIGWHADKPEPTFKSIKPWRA
jgi:hypothetical protein